MHRIEIDLDNTISERGSSKTIVGSTKSTTGMRIDHEAPSDMKNRIRIIMIPRLGTPKERKK